MTVSLLTKVESEKIESTVKETLNNITSNEPGAWLKHWTSDAVLMPPGTHSLVGRDALAMWIEDWPPIKRFEVETIAVEGSHNLAVVVCDFVRVVERDDGSEERQLARQMLKLRKQPDDTWQIAAAIFNSRV